MNWSSCLRSGLTLSVAESGDGKPMIFQHGLCGDATQPAQVFPEGIGWRCLTLECRGHGHSEAGVPSDFSIATFNDDLTDFIQQRELERPVVGGISMGAALSLRLAVKRPDLVSALVLARPAWLEAPNPPNLRPNALVGRLLRDYSASEARARFEASETAKQLSLAAPDNLASLRGFFSRQPFSITAELLCRISEDGPGVSQAELGKINLPTLVIGHEQDAVHPMSYARTLAQWIPKAHLVQITPKALDLEAYHNDFRTALKSFLSSL